jgi:hypothetical protein
MMLESEWSVNSKEKFEVLRIAGGGPLERDGDRTSQRF